MTPGRGRTLALAVAMSATVVTPLAVTGAHHALSGDDVATTAGESGDASTEVALDSAPAAQNVDSDVADGSAPVKEVTSQKPFSMIGVAWTGSHPQATAKVRAKNPDGTWGQWFDADSTDGESRSTTGRGGTDPIFLGTETTSAQIRVEGVDVAQTSVGAAPQAGAPEQAAPAENTAPSENAPAPNTAPAPADIAGTPQQNTPPAPTAFADIKPVAEQTPASGMGASAVLLSPDQTPTPEADTGYADVAADGGTGARGKVAAKQPNMISRKGWGANEGINCMDPEYDDSLAAAVVHHTAGSNNYTKEQSASVVRGIYQYHAVNLGWCDVGYNVLVDKYGQAFEGRAGGLTRNVQGAHAGGFNANTFGISMMGDYSSIAPPDVTIQKVGQIIGWRLAIAGVDPKGKDQHVSEGTSYSKYAQGTRVTLPNIFAHRDVGTTTCPGDRGYSKMNRIRDIAAAYAKGDGGATGGTPGGGTSGNNGTGAPDSTKPLDPSAVQQQLAEALKTLLKGGRLDPGSVSSLLGNGATLKDLQVDPASAKNGLGTLQQLAARLSPQLGKALSGLQRYGNVSYAKFENGAVYEGPQTGAHAVWGRLGDAWAAQGFEHGPLGLPTAEEEQRPDGTVAQRFEHGSLVFDPATGQVTPAG